MAKFFPLVKRVTKVVEVPVGDGSTVNQEQLRYDNRNAGDKATETVATQVNIAELGQKADETVTAAFAAEVFEVGERAIEDINNEVTAVVVDVGSRATDIVTTVAVVDEQAQRADDTVSVDAEVVDVAKKANEDINNAATAVVLDANKQATDILTAAIIPTIDAGQTAFDNARIDVSYTGYVNQASQTGDWQNPNNTIDDTTGTASTINATSSGLAGTTSNTSTGTLVMELENPSPLISDLNISTPITVEIERQVVTAGVAPLGQSLNVAYEYQVVGSGSGFQPIATDTAAQAKGFVSAQIPSLTYDNIDNLQLRAVATVTSGAGLGASVTASVFRARVRFDAGKDY